MRGKPDPLYVKARKVLLDLLEALQDHRDALVLVGAQAVYVHTGDTELDVAEYTTDADFSISPRDLAGTPFIEDLLMAAQFSPGPQPGSWRSPDGVVVDLMVPEVLAGPGSRSATLSPHAKYSARRAKGIEGSLVDRDRKMIRSLDPLDPRSSRLWVAGPAALLVAKVHKIHERKDAPGRVIDKDALDVFRLLQSFPTSVVVERLDQLRESELARKVTREADVFLPELFGSLDSPGVAMAVRALNAAPVSQMVAQSLVTLVEDLYR